MKTKAGDVIIALIEKDALAYKLRPPFHVGHGDLNLLGDAFAGAGMRLRNAHPLNQLKAVLDALDRDHRFVKYYYNIYGKRCRIFRLAACAFFLPPASK